MACSECGSVDERKQCVKAKMRVEELKRDVNAEVAQLTSAGHFGPEPPTSEELECIAGMHIGEDAPLSSTLIGSKTKFFGEGEGCGTRELHFRSGRGAGGRSRHDAETLADVKASSKSKKEAKKASAKEAKPKASAAKSKKEAKQERGKESIGKGG